MISLIAAIGQGGVIGSNGKVPWHYREDMAFFKKQTIGSTVIMGGNTYRSLNGPLPGRTNIVISRSLVNEIPCMCVNNEFAALAMAQLADQDIYIIGGASIYNQLFHVVQKMYITWVHKKYDGDTFLHLDFSKFSAGESLGYGAHAPELEFRVYTRKC